MSTETALAAAMKSAVQTMSRKKQTDMIVDHIYSKYPVFKKFKPLAIGVHENLIADMPQFDASLITRAVSLHCNKVRYLRALSRGGKRFDLRDKPKSDISEAEQDIARQKCSHLIEISKARKATQKKADAAENSAEQSVDKSVEQSAEATKS